MKKRIWICLVLSILFVCLIGVLAGCNPDETSEETTSPLAGKFVNNSGYWLDYDQYVISHTLEFFSDGTAKMQVKGYLLSTGEPVNFTLNGVYLWQKGDSVIYCTWTDSSVVEYLYNGTEIHTGYAHLSCVGWNSLGEFEGLCNLAYYGSSGPGRIEGEVMQFIPDGESARTVTAVPSLGAEFVRWSDGVMTATRTDNSVSDNIEVHAEFKRVTDVFSLKYSAGTGGTIQGEANQEVLVNGSGTEVTAVPDEGYGFIKWSDGVTTATRTDTNITQHLSVTAEFGRKITLSYSAGEGGTVQGETTQELIEGTAGTSVTAVPNEGWYFVSWTDGVDTPTRTDTPSYHGNSTVSFKATFAPYHTVKYILYGEGGTIQGDTTQLVKPEETPTAVTAVPDEGYKLKGWYEDSVSDGNLLVAAGETFSGGPIRYYGDGTTTYYVAFEPIEYICTYYAATGGTVNGSANRCDSIATVLTGYATAEILAVPESGYVFTGWSDGRTDNPRVDIIDPDNPQTVTVTARFARGYTLTYTAGAGGTIEGEAVQNVLGGDSGTAVTAVPNEGYAFVRWSDGVTTATRTDTDVAGNISVTAEFASLCHLTYVAGEGGTIEGETVQSVPVGGSGTAVTAVPNEGYAFVRWSDGVTTATRTDTDVAGNISVTAEFASLCHLTYVAGEGGTIEGETVQSVPVGGSGTAVTAVPNEGYAFVRWSDGVTTATRTDEDVASNISVTAEFEIDPDHTPFAGGDGSVENPYMIDSLSRLRIMSLYPSAHFVLTADIVLPEVSAGNNNFTPLFSDENPFSGTLDGAGHKITNLTVYNTETFYSGLFSVIGSTGSVKNLTLENASASGTNYVGIIAGWSLGSITDCTVSGAVTHIAVNGYKVFVGGIAGRAEGNVNGCSAAVDLTVTEAQVEIYVGGIVGYLSSGGSSSSPLMLTASGTISVSGAPEVYVGGLMGRASSSAYLSKCHTEMQITAIGSSVCAGGLVGDGYGSITDSYATGDVTASGSSSAYAGGLIGYNINSVTITDSYATGDVTAIGSSSAYAGGLIGYNNGSITITDSYATGNVTASSDSYATYAGGLIGYGSSITITDSYATGDVTASGSSSAYAGGLIGYNINSITITDSYATGNVTASSDLYNTYAGGLVGYGYSTITDSYATGDVTASGSSSAYVGGLVGYATSITVRNAYSSSAVSAESGGTVYAGGLAGYVRDSVSLENAHWLKSADTDAAYAVGYSDSLGVPTSIGSTSHTILDEFYALADTLNAGREVPVWEHTGENTLPSLIIGGDESA